MPNHTREVLPQETDALAAVVGKKIVRAYRGTGGFTDQTIFLQFEDGTALHVIDPYTLYFNRR